MLLSTGTRAHLVDFLVVLVAAMCVLIVAGTVTVLRLPITTFEHRL
jgi:hypothetical protein